MIHLRKHVKSGGRGFYLRTELGRYIEYAEEKVEMMDLGYVVRNNVVHFKTIEHVEWYWRKYAEFFYERLQQVLRLLLTFTLACGVRYRTVQYSISV